MPESHSGRLHRTCNAEHKQREFESPFRLEEENKVEKHCDICKKVVKETIHTQDGWFVGYFESHKKGETIVVCADCKYGKKKKTLG